MGSDRQPRFSLRHETRLQLLALASGVPAIIILATLGLSHGLEMGLQPLLRLRSHHPPARA